MPTGIAQPKQNHKTTQKQNCFLLKWFVSLLASMMQRQKQVFHKDNDLYATIIPFSATILSSILIFWRLSVGMWRSRFLEFFLCRNPPPVISVVGNLCYLIQEFHLGIVRLPTIFHPLFIQLFQKKRYRVLGKICHCLSFSQSFSSFLSQFLVLLSSAKYLENKWDMNWLFHYWWANQYVQILSEWVIFLELSRTS